MELLNKYKWDIYQMVIFVLKNMITTSAQTMRNKVLQWQFTKLKGTRILCPHWAWTLPMFTWCQVCQRTSWSVLVFSRVIDFPWKAMKDGLRSHRSFITQLNIRDENVFWKELCTLSVVIPMPHSFGYLDSQKTEEIIFQDNLRC